MASRAQDPCEHKDVTTTCAEGMTFDQGMNVCVPIVSQRVRALISEPTSGKSEAQRPTKVS